MNATRRAGDRQRAPAIGLQREQHGPDREQRPGLVGDGEPEQDPGQRRAPAQRGEHRAGGERAAEQLLGMADVERAQRDRVDGAEADDGGDGPAGALRASICPASTTPSATPASRHGTRRRGTPRALPRPTGRAAIANGARMISEPP